jgi:endonuclease YncB( thermonuclease family)
LPLSLDPYGRTVATWSVDGTDLGEWLVRKGLALDCPNTRTADMMALGTTPNVPAGKSGRAAMSSRGSIAPASART